MKWASGGRGQPARPARSRYVGHVRRSAGVVALLITAITMLAVPTATADDTVPISDGDPATLRVIVEPVQDFHVAAIGQRPVGEI
jgi:hypothetical protein